MNSVFAQYSLLHLPQLFFLHTHPRTHKYICRYKCDRSKAIQDVIYFSGSLENCIFQVPPPPHLSLSAPYCFSLHWPCCLRRLMLGFTFCVAVSVLFWNLWICLALESGQKRWMFGSGLKVLLMGTEQNFGLITPNAVEIYCHCKFCDLVLSWAVIFSQEA